MGMITQVTIMHLTHPGIPMLYANLFYFTSAEIHGVARLVPSPVLLDALEQVGQLGSRLDLGHELVQLGLLVRT